MLSFVLIVCVLLVLLAIGLPVAFSLGATSLTLIWLYDLPMRIVGLTVFSALEGFVLLAVPLYILMSQILLSGKVGDNLFEVMNVWVRHFPGGLATATILACAFFAAITGSGGAPGSGGAVALVGAARAASSCGSHTPQRPILPHSTSGSIRQKHRSPRVLDPP